MADQSLVHVHHYNVPTHMLEHQLQRELPSAPALILLHHIDCQMTGKVSENPAWDVIWS